MRGISAREYAQQIGKSVTTARKRLENLVAEGKARRIHTYRAWHHRFGRQKFGTVSAIEYDIDS
jgi:DNA-binding Lrp family transcriptional regulator